MKCKRCDKPTRLRTHKYCSKECYWETLKGIKGKKAPNYKEVVGKSQVHRWMDVHYGTDKVCEMKDCKGKSGTFDWALKKGKQYERKKSNFLRLCRSCHRKYDLTPEKRRQAIKNLWWSKGIKNPGPPNIQNLWFNKDKEKTKQNEQRKLAGEV